LEDSDEEGTSLPFVDGVEVDPRARSARTDSDSSTAVRRGGAHTELTWELHSQLNELDTSKLLFDTESTGKDMGKDMSGVSCGKPGNSKITTQ